MTTTMLEADVATPATSRELKLHPVTALFPPLSDEDYRALRDDINTNGLREAIWVYEGQVIDGAHRLRACRELKKEPTMREWKRAPGESLVKLVASLNLRRRHLTPGQRARVAAAMKPMIQQELEAERVAEEEVAPNGAHSPKPGRKTASKEAITIAAQITGASTRTTERTLAEQRAAKPVDPAKAAEHERREKIGAAVRCAYGCYDNLKELCDSLLEAKFPDEILTTIDESLKDAEMLIPTVKELLAKA